MDTSPKAPCHFTKTSTLIPLLTAYLPLSSIRSLLRCSRTTLRKTSVSLSWSKFLSQPVTPTLTQQHTRHCTIRSCLSKLYPETSSKYLIVYCLGSDFREGTSVSSIVSTFQPLLSTQYSKLLVYLIGPNLTSSSSLESPTYTSTNLKIVSYRGLFHEIPSTSFETTSSSCCIQLAVAFNAGIWGYDTWKPTIQKVCHEMRLPLLITSYNKLESEDDYDFLCDMKGLTFPWGPPSLNPFGSLLEWNSVYDGETQSDNRYWVLCCHSSDDGGDEE